MFLTTSLQCEGTTPWQCIEVHINSNSKLGNHIVYYHLDGSELVFCMLSMRAEDLGGHLQVKLN